MKLVTSGVMAVLRLLHQPPISRGSLHGRLVTPNPVRSPNADTSTSGIGLTHYASPPPRRDRKARITIGPMPSYRHFEHIAAQENITTSEAEYHRIHFLFCP